MIFGEEQWNVLLPSYLSDENKGRLKSSLEQFHPANRNAISYENFYKNYGYDYFLQGDIIFEIRSANWDKEKKSYEKSYSDGLVISNTCDISFDNKRGVNPKQCLFAPLLDLEEYIKDLVAAGYSDQSVEEFRKNLKCQLYSNIFYLPKVNEDDIERIALLDRIFWYPIDELEDLLPTINNERLASLTPYGFYLLVFKLSYHFCRVPEENDRESA